MFIKILEKRPKIWNEYADWIKDNIRFDGYEQKVFELIWKYEKWEECIQYAYLVFIEDNRIFYLEHPIRLLFGRTENESKVVMNRKKRWLLDKLHKESTDVSKSNKVIEVVVNVLPHWKMEFVCEYLKYNKKVEDFKKIHLFPMLSSWSGSQVPLIIDKIEFLQMLKERLKGIDYIDHRRYIDEMCRNLEKNKEDVELREYLDNVDYV